MSTSGAVKPSCWKEKGSNATPSNTDACFTKLTQPKIKPNAPDSPLNWIASCPKISDDGHRTIRGFSLRIETCDPYVPSCWHVESRRIRRWISCAVRYDFRL